MKLHTCSLAPSLKMLHIIQIFVNFGHTSCVVVPMLILPRNKLNFEIEQCQSVYFLFHTSRVIKAQR